MYKVTFLLYHQLLFLNLFVIYLFRQRLPKTKVSNCRRLVTIFYFTCLVDRIKQLFKVGLRYSFIHQNDLIDIETLRNTDIPSGVFIVNFEK